jgi:hypothetical protein
VKRYIRYIPRSALDSLFDHLHSLTHSLGKIWLSIRVLM